MLHVISLAVVFFQFRKEVEFVKGINHLNCDNSQLILLHRKFLLFKVFHVVKEFSNNQWAELSWLTF
ncbi:MAG: hypothetical protein CMA09_02135 [Euryarchaeota archaeon]|nr:hypothetical protein [Euryarchaeota archaeon]